MQKMNQILHEQNLFMFDLLDQQLSFCFFYYVVFFGFFLFCLDLLYTRCFFSLLLFLCWMWFQTTTKKNAQNRIVKYLLLNCGFVCLFDSFSFVLHDKHDIFYFSLLSRVWDRSCLLFGLMFCFGCVCAGVRGLLVPFFFCFGKRFWACVSSRDDCYCWHVCGLIFVLFACLYVRFFGWHTIDVFL